MTITTDRLLLRPFRASDVAAVHAYASDPAVVRFMDWGPNTMAETRAYVDRILAPPAGQHPFAVVRTADGMLLGGAELQMASIEHRRADMGYVLSPGAWGNGYATEAAAALLHFGFDRLGLHKLSATCDPENAGSARVLEKIGMHREGMLRDHLLIRGEWRDRLLWAALRDRPRRAADRIGPRSAGRTRR
jgi:ribosomal-protein-alanine N-acetyltransferase